MMSFDVVSSTSYTHTLKQCDFEREQGKVRIHNVRNVHNVHNVHNQGYYKKDSNQNYYTFYVFLGN